MEETDLIDFHSPKGLINTASAIKSPGNNNPFDMLWTLAENFSNMGVTNPIQEISLQFPDNSFNSMDNIFNSNPDNLFNGDEFPRESLGILKLEILNASMEDLNFTNSFGISKSATDTCFLNTAFLCPNSYCDSKSSFAYLSNASSTSLNPSYFNSGSLEDSEPSKIYSINSSIFKKNLDCFSKTENILNDAFLNSVTSSLYTNEHEARLRLFSLPELNTIKIRVDNLLSKSENYAHGNLPVSKKPADMSELNKSDLNCEDVFNDSVFIEAHHFTSKLADGSILSTNCFEDNLLDCTSPPEFGEDIDILDPEEINNQDIFKCIDKLIPTSEKKETVIPSSGGHASCDDAEAQIPNIKWHSPITKQNSLALKENLSNIFKRKSSSSNGSSKDANELLQNLSEIINTENRRIEQNLEGQKLLFGLADILCSNISLKRPSDSLDDSGHSSIENEEQHTDSDHISYEVLDLRIASKSADNEQALDLSLKGRQCNSSFNFPRQKSQKAGQLLNNVKHLSSSPTFGSSLNHGKSINNFGQIKLKTKRVEDNIPTKRGPLKAVIPIGSMSKHQNYMGKIASGSVTPPRTENSQSTSFKVKRTSTPIMEPKLKPMAQSTPDGPNLELSKPKSSYSTSKLLSKPKTYSPESSQLPRKISVAENTSVYAKLNKSSPYGPVVNSAGRPSLQSATLTRRHSESELKDNKPSVTLKRSYSIGKGANEKPKTNALELKKSVSKNTLSSDNQKPNNILKEKNRGIIQNMKQFNWLNKMKKNKTGNKENSATTS